MKLKTITLSFRVPEDTDWPSEKLNLAKQMLLEALTRSKTAGYFHLSESPGFNLYNHLNPLAVEGM